MVSSPQHVLIVAGGPTQRPHEYAETILSAQLVVAVDAGAELCRSISRWPDHLIGDLDSITPETLKAATEAGTVVHALEANKDYSDLDAALQMCHDLAVAPPLTLTAVSHGREDHFLSVCGSLARHADMSPVIDEPDTTAWVLSPCGCTSLTLSGMGGLFSVLALLGPANVSIKGARYPLSNVELDALSAHGLSNVIAGESATVTVHAGTVIVMSPQIPESPYVSQLDAKFV